MWRVTPQNEVLRASSPDLARGWLCFESDGEKRRLANPADGWDTHTDAELDALLRLAAAVVKRAEKRQTEPA